MEQAKARTTPACRLVIRIDSEGLAQFLPGLGEASLQEKLISQVAVGIGEVGFKPQSPPKAFARFRKLPLLNQRGAQIVVQVGQIRVEGKRLAIAICRSGKIQLLKKNPAQLAQRLPQTNPCIRRIGSISRAWRKDSIASANSFWPASAVPRL